MLLKYRVWVLAAVAVFSAGILSGLVTPETGAVLFEEDLAALEELAARLGPFQASTAVFIFLKNALALAVSFVFSPFLLLAPLLALAVNGWVLAYVSVLVIKEESLGFLLAGLLPHGVFELPAIIIGEAAALSFGAAVIAGLFSKPKRSLIMVSMRQNARYMLIAFTLLLPAAIIETYISPLLLS